MIILIDLDNTLAEFDAGLLAAWRAAYPSEQFVPLKERRSFHTHNDYPEALQDKVIELCHRPGFILGLQPTPGGIDAVEMMIKRGHDVRFCSSHLEDYKHCVQEKYQWTERYFGMEAIDRIIFTRDKTLIRGDLLIDDKPLITGSLTPTWEHVLYDRPYNQQANDKRRLTWDNWQEILPELKQRQT
jgi:5'-nucleotidase